MVVSFALLQPVDGFFHSIVRNVNNNFHFEEILFRQRVLFFIFLLNNLVDEWKNDYILLKHRKSFLARMFESAIRILASEKN